MLDLIKLPWKLMANKVLGRPNTKYLGGLEVVVGTMSFIVQLFAAIILLLIF